MGSFSINCRISGVGIAAGEPVVALLVNKLASTGYHKVDAFALAAPPVYGKYNDYGRARCNFDQKVLGKPVIEYWEDALGDLSEFKDQDYEELTDHLFERSARQLDSPRGGAAKILEVAIVHQYIWDALSLSVFKDDLWIGHGWSRRKTSLESFDSDMETYLDKYMERIFDMRKQKELVVAGDIHSGSQYLYNRLRIEVPFLTGNLIGFFDEMESASIIEEGLFLMTCKSGNLHLKMLFGSGFSDQFERELTNLFFKTPYATFLTEEFQEQARHILAEAIYIAAELIVIANAIERGGGNLHRKTHGSQDVCEDQNDQLQFYKRIAKAIKQLKKDRKADEE